MAVELPRLEVVADLVGALGDTRGAIDVVGPWGSAKPLIAAQAAAAMDRPLVYVTAGRLDAESSA